MGEIIESLSLAVILILLVLLVGHLLNGDAIEWIKSKAQVAEGIT